MKTKFWTALQCPLWQAALVEDGRIIKTIPANSPKTIARRVINVGEYKNTLILMRHSSFEQWDKEGTEHILGFHSRHIYTPHAVVKFEEDLLICSSGLDLFIIMDLEGNTKWGWWAYKYDMGGRPDYFFKKDWITQQITKNPNIISDKIGAHFNSIWMNKGKILTSALKRREIIEITPYKEGYEHIAWTEDGVHSPIYNDGILIYGTENGIKVGDQKVLTQFKWIKYVRKIEFGFVFTCEEGVIFTDDEWQVIKKITLPRPFQLAFLEISE